MLSTWRRALARARVSHETDKKLLYLRDCLAIGFEYTSPHLEHRTCTMRDLYRPTLSTPLPISNEKQEDFNLSRKPTSSNSRGFTLEQNVALEEPAGASKKGRVWYGLARIQWEPGHFLKHRVLRTGIRCKALMVRRADVPQLRVRYSFR